MESRSSLKCLQSLACEALCLRLCSPSQYHMSQALATPLADEKTEKLGNLCKVSEQGGRGGRGRGNEEPGEELRLPPLLSTNLHGVLKGVLSSLKGTIC